MKNINLYPIIIFLSIALLLWQWGCAHTPKKPFPSEQAKVDLGTIGIVTASFTPEVKFEKPLGKGTGAGVGVVAGAAVAAGSVLYVAYCAGPVGLLLLAYPPVTAVAGGITGAGALIGGIVGAVKGESSKKKKETEVALNSILFDLKIQEAMRDHIFKEGQEQTRHHLVLLDNKGPVTPDEKVDYHSLTNEGIDTVIEISPLKFGLVRKEININPPLSFQMKVRARLVRVVDGAELYAHTFKYESARKKFIDWSADNGQPFKEEFNQGIQSLARDIVEVIFLRYYPSELNNTHITDPRLE